MAKSNKTKIRKHINFKGIAKFLIPLFVGGVAVASIYNVKAKSDLLSFYLEEECYAVQDNETLNSLDASAYQSTKLVKLSLGDPVYSDESGKNISIGEQKTKINDDYPLFARSGEVLYFINDKNTLINSSWEELPTYEGLRITDGSTFNANETKADFDDILFVRIGSLYQVVQDTTVSSNIANRTIGKNTICEFTADGINCYELFGDQMRSYRIPVYGDSKITIGDNRLSYASLLDQLNLLKKDKQEEDEEFVLDNPNSSASDEDEEEKQGTPRETVTDVADLPSVKTDLPNTIQPRQPVRQDNTQVDWKSCEVIVDPNATSWTYLVSFNIKTKDEASVIKSGIKFLAYDKTLNSNPPSISYASVAEDSIPRHEGWYEKLENEFGVVTYKKTRDKEPVEDKKYYICSTDPSKVIWIKKVFYSLGYFDAQIQGNDIPTGIDIYEKVDDGLGNVSYVLTTDTQIQQGKVYYKYDYHHIVSEDGDNPSANGWYEKNGDSYVLSTDINVSSTCYTVGKQKNRSSYIATIEETDGVVDVGQLQPNTEYLIGYEYDYYDNTNSLETETQYIGIYSTSDYDQLDPISLSFDGDDLEEIEVFQNKLQIRGLRFDNIFNGEDAQMGEPKVAQAVSDKKKTESYVTKVAVQYQEIKYNNFHSALPPEDTSWLNMSLDSGALNVIKKGFKLTKWDSDTKLSYGKEYYYRIRLYDKYGYEFVYDGNMSNFSSPQIFKAYTSKNSPTVSITIPSSSNKVGSVVVNAKIKNDAHVPITNFTDQIKGQDLSSYQAVMFFTAATSECVPENAIPIKGIRNNSDGTTTNFDSDGIYYLPISVMGIVPNDLSGNPSTKGWYELSGSSYVFSPDTSKQLGKTYYFDDGVDSSYKITNLSSNTPYNVGVMLGSFDCNDNKIHKNELIQSTATFVCGSLKNYGNIQYYGTATDVTHNDAKINFRLVNNPNETVYNTVLNSLIQYVELLVKNESDNTTTKLTIFKNKNGYNLDSNAPEYIFPFNPDIDSYEFLVPVYINDNFDDVYFMTLRCELSNTASIPKYKVKDMLTDVITEAPISNVWNFFLSTSNSVDANYWSFNCLDFLKLSDSSSLSGYTTINTPTINLAKNSDYKVTMNIYGTNDNISYENLVTSSSKAVSFKTTKQEPTADFADIYIGDDFIELYNLSFTDPDRSIESSTLSSDQTNAYVQIKLGDQVISKYNVNTALDFVEISSSDIDEGACPKDNLWFEKNDDTYILTQDLAVDSSKVYFKKYYSLIRISGLTKNTNYTLSIVAKNFNNGKLKTVDYPLVLSALSSYNNQVKSYDFYTSSLISGEISLNSMYRLYYDGPTSDSEQKKSLGLVSANDWEYDSDNKMYITKDYIPLDKNAYYSLRTGLESSDSYVSTLPTSLKELEYIQVASANQYIITDYLPNNNTVVELKGLVVNPYSLFGNHPNDNSWFNITASGNKYRYRNGTSTTYDFGTLDPDPHTFELSSSKVVYDGAEISTPITTTTFSSTVPAAIFARITESGTFEDFAGVGSRIYYLRIMEENTIIHDFVPCEAIEAIPDYMTNIKLRVSSGTIGLYDTITETFYVNSSNGNFAAPEATATTGEESYLTLSVYQKMDDTTYNLIKTYSGNLLLNGNLFKLDDIYTGDNYCAKLSFSNLPDSYSISNVVLEEFSDEKVDSQHNLMNLLQGSKSFVENTAYDKDGNKISIEGYAITNDYLEVIPDSVYYIEGINDYVTNYYNYKRTGSTIDQALSDQTSSNHYILFYNDGKEFVGYTTTGAQGSLFKTPANAKYLKFYIRGKQTNVDYSSVEEPEGLPNGYQEVQYIQATSSAYIDSGILGGSSTRVVFEYSSTNVEQMFFGARTAGSKAEYSVLRDGSGNISARHNTKSKSGPKATFLDDTPQRIDRNNNITTIYNSNNAVITTISNTSSSFSTAYTIHFPGINQAGTHGGISKLKIYSIKIYRPTTTLVRDYIPCYRKSDGAAGLYDLVTKTFSVSAGAVAFTKGPDVGEDDIEQLRVGFSYGVNSQNDRVRRSDRKYMIPFYPKADGIYSIYTTNLVSGDPYLMLYDEDNNLLAQDDDSAGNHNAKITYNFDSKRNYYVPATFGEIIPPVDNPKNNGWYENSGGSYTPTNDTVPVTSKTYYDTSYNIDTTTTNPQAGKLYEVVGDNYVLTGDTTRQAGKDYYALSYVPATLYVANPKEENWYERQGSNYSLSNDTAANSSKHYYLPSTFDQVTSTGNENPKSLNWYIKENGIYYKSNSEKIESSVYYVQMTHSNQLIASEIKYDVRVSDYQYSYNYDNVGIFLYQSANLDYFNIEVEAKINQEADKTVDKEYFKNVSGTIVPISEDDLIAMYDLGDTPAGLGWYEKQFVLSVDTDRDPNKNYYIEKCRYELVTVNSGDNPSSLGWYERSGGKFVLSTDASALSTKKYFVKYTNNEFKITTALVSPVDNSMYELVYVPTADTNIVQKPFYYAQGGTAKIVLYKTKDEITKDDNLELFEDDKWLEYKTMYTYDDIVGASSIRLGEIDDNYIISSIVESNYGYKVVLSVNREGKSGQTVLDYINVSAIQPTYIIKDIPSLKAVATNPTGYYICVADIKGVDFCAYDGIFTGIIDFQGHTIELTSNNYLFKQLSSEAIIKNVNFVYDPLVNEPSEDKQLPAGYTQIESITGTGSQYINTGYYHTPSSRYEFEVNINKINVSGVWGGMFGSRPSSGYNNSAAFFYHTSGYYVYHAHGVSVSLPAHSVVFEKWNKITYTQQKIEVNDKQYIINRSINNGSYPDYIFAVDHGGSPVNFCSMSLRSFKIYEGNTLMRDYVPCVNPTGEVGMYDKVNNIFYDNAGAGEFLAEVAYSEDGSTISGITSNTSINYSNVTNCLGGNTAPLVLNNYGTLNNIIMHYAPDTEVHEIYNEDIYYFEVSDGATATQYRLVGNDSWYVMSPFGYEICHPDNATKNKMLQTGTGLNIYSYSNDTWRLESSTDSSITPGDVNLSPEKISGLKLVNSEYIQKRTSPYTLDVNSSGLVLNNYGTIDGFAMNYENDVYVKDNVAGIALNNYGTIRNGYVSGSKINNNSFMSENEDGTHYAGLIHRMNYFTGVVINGSNYSYSLSENQTKGSYISYISSYNNVKSNIENVYVVNDLRFQSSINSANEYGGWESKEVSVETTLPSGFIAVDCIKTEGNNYIDTNLTTSDNITKITADFSFDTLYNGTMSLFGAGIYGYATTGLVLTFNPATTGSHYIYSGYYTAFTYTWQKDRKYSVEAYTNDTNRVLLINGTKIVDAARTKAVSANLKYYIFANSETATPSRYSRGVLLYAFKMYQGDNCVRDYVPCVAIENVPSSSTGSGKTAPAGTMGLYDLVTKKFYFTSGTGAISYPNSSSTISDDNYQQVEYIESFSYGTSNSSSGQTIDTNISFQANKTYTWDIDFAITKFNGGETDIMGVNSGSYNFTVGSNSSNQWISTGHASGTSYYSTASASVGTNIKAKGSTTSTNTINEKLYLFAQNNSGTITNKSSIKLFAAKIYENNVLIRNYIPCFRKSDKKPGLYDVVSGTFVVNSGDGEFYYDFEQVPSEYQRVEYITSSGNAYIDTGYVHNGNTKYEAVLSGNNTALFGAQNASAGYIGSLALFIQTGNKFNYRNNTTGIAYDTDGHSFGSVYMHVVSSPTILQLNSKVIASYSPGSFGANSLSCYLFGVNKDGALDPSKQAISIRRFKIFEGNNLLHDYVPCYEKETKVIGLYDIVEGVFKTNSSSSGTFTKGKDINVKSVSIERRDFTLFGTDYSSLICGYNEGNIINSYSVGDLYDFDTATNSSSIQYDEFEILNYVESTANQYVNIGFTPASNSKIVFDYQFLVDTSNAQIGCGTANNSRRAFIQVTSPNLTFGLGTNCSSTFPKNKDRHIYTLDLKNKKGLVDGVTVSTSSVTKITPDKAFFVFSRNDGGTPSNYFHAGRFYGLKYYENEILKKVFVPAKRSSDGTVGILESLTMTFYLPTGSVPLISGGSVGSSEGISASLTQHFNGQTVMYRSGPSVGATVNLGKNSNIKYASLDTDGLTYYNKKSWGTAAKSYMHNDNVGTTALSLSNTQWQEQILGPDGTNFLIKDYLGISKFPTIAWPSNFPTSTIPLIDIPSVTSGIRILSNTVRMKGVDSNNNQAALISIDYYNPSKINPNTISIVDSSEDGSRELTSKVISNTQVEGAIYRVDVLVTYAGRDVIASTNEDVVSVSNEKIVFKDGTTYNLVSQKPIVSVDDFNLKDQLIAVSAKAQEVYQIVSINGTNVGSSGENNVVLDFYNSIGSIDDWKNYFTNTYSLIEGNYRLINDLDFSNSLSTDWHVDQPFNGVINGAIYQTQAVEVTDSSNVTYYDESGAPVVIYNEGDLIGMRTISGIGNVDSHNNYVSGKGYTSSTESYSYDSSLGSKFSLFYKLNGVLENIIFDNCITINDKNNPNSSYDVTTPICGIVQNAENGSLIDNCHVRNSSFNTRGIGGSLVGYATGSNIINSSVKDSTISSNVLVSSSDSAILGGLVGYSNNSLISNSYVSNVTIDNSNVVNVGGTGGLIGIADYSNIHACYVAGGSVISNGDFSGGLIGKVGKNANSSLNEFDYRTSIDNCWTTINVQTNKGDFVGGLVGYMGIYNGSGSQDTANKLINCYTSSTILSLSYDSIHVNRITSFDFDNAGYYSNNFALASQSMSYKNDDSSDIGIYQFGPSEALNGASRLLKAEEIRNPRTWTEEMKFNTAYYDLSSQIGQELIYMPKLLNSDTGLVLYGQNDELLGVDEYAELSVVSITNNRPGKFLSITVDLKNSGWDQAELFGYNNDLSQNKWNDLAIWSDMYCSGGKVDYREDGIVEGSYIKPISVRYEGSSAVARFVTDIYYDDPESGHYANSYLLSIPIYLNSPNTTPRIYKNTFALVVVDEENKVRKEISNAHEWNEFFSDTGSHYNVEESILLTGNLYKFDAHSFIDGSPTGGSGKPAYNVKLANIKIDENVHPVFTGLVEYDYINDASFISSLSGDVSGIKFEDFTIDYGNSSCLSYSGIIGQIDGNFKDMVFDNVSIKNIDSDNVGLIGFASKGSVIDNVSLNDIDISVIGNHNNIGSFIGLVNGGQNSNIAISNVTANSIHVKTSGNDSKNVGGLFGNISYADLDNIVLDANKITNDSTDSFEDLDYIEASGKQYIDLGIDNIGDWKIETSVTMTDDNSSKNYIAGNAGDISLYTDTDNYLYATTNNNSAHASIYNRSINREIKLSWDKVDSIKINGEDDVLSSIGGTKNGNLGNSLCLFSNGTNASTYSSLRMYYFTIYDGNNAICHLIPKKSLHDNTVAYRGTTSITVRANTVGLYDTISKKFYVSSTDNSFTNEEVIPAVFKKVDYIQSNYKNNQFIRTGISLEDGYRITGQAREFYSNNSGDYRVLLGAGKTATPNTSMFIGWQGNKVDGSIQTTTNGSSITTVPTNTMLYFDMAAGSSGSYVKLNGYSAPVKNGYYPITSNEAIIFATNSSDGLIENINQFSTSRIYSLQFYYDDYITLRRNYIPVIANEDIPAYLTNIGTAVSKGTAGLYDTVTGLFFINSGTDNSSFMYSTMTNELPDELQQVEYIQSKGGAYIDVGAQAGINSTIDIDFNINKDLYYKDSEANKSEYIFGNAGYAMKAYGKTISSSTDIMTIVPFNINTNGLPAGYTELPYIQSNENQWINTGISSNMVQSIDFGFSIDPCTANNRSLLSGVRNDITIGTNTTLGYYVRVNGSERINVTSGLSENSINRIRIENGNVYLNNVSKKTYSAPISSKVDNIFLGNNTYLDAGASAKYYYLKIYTNSPTTQPEIDFVPCFRNSDHEVGMFNKTNNQFYPSESTVSFYGGYPYVSNVNNNSLNYSIRHQLVTNLGSNLVTIDDEAYRIVGLDNYSNISSVGDVTLFSVNDGVNTNQTDMTLYHYAQYDNNNRLVRNLIPSFTKTNISYGTTNGATTRSVPKGTVGLYDTVSGKFFVNAGGSGELICDNNYSKLPSNYQRLKYVSNVAGQYIDTGIVDKKGYVYEIKYSAPSQGKAGIFGGNGRGIISNESGNYTLYIDGVNSNNVVGYSSQVVVNRLKDAQVINPNTGTNASLVDSHVYDDGSGNTMSIFRISNTSLTSYGDVYYLKVWNERGILIGDFVPCINNSDGQIGLYNLIDNQFHSGSLIPSSMLPEEEFEKYVYDNENDYDYNTVLSGSVGPTAGIAALVNNTNISNVSINRLNVFTLGGQTAGGFASVKGNSVISSIPSISNINVRGGSISAGFSECDETNDTDYSNHFVKDENSGNIIQGTKVKNINIVGNYCGGITYIVGTGQVNQYYVIENEYIYSGGSASGGFNATCQSSSSTSGFSDFILKNINLYNDIYASDSRHCGAIAGYDMNVITAKNIVTDDVKIRTKGYANGGLFGRTQTFNMSDSSTTNIDIISSSNYSGGIVGEFATNLSITNSPTKNIYLFGGTCNGGIYGRVESGSGTSNIIDSPVENVNLNVNNSWAGGIAGQSQNLNLTRSPINKITADGLTGVGGLIGNSKLSGSILGNVVISDSTLNNINVRGTAALGGVVGVHTGTSGSTVLDGNGTSLTNLDVFCYRNGKVGGIIGGIADNYNIIRNFNIHDGNIISVAGDAGGIAGIAWACENDVVGQAEHATSSTPGAISREEADVLIMGKTNVAGVIAFQTKYANNYGSFLSNSIYNTYIVSNSGGAAKSYVGGIIAYNQHTAARIYSNIVKNCTIINNAGTAASYVAGIMATDADDSIPTSFPNNTVENTVIVGNNSSASGIAGKLNRTDLLSENVVKNSVIIGKEQVSGIASDRALGNIENSGIEDTILLSTTGKAAGGIIANANLSSYNEPKLLLLSKDYVRSSGINKGYTLQTIINNLHKKDLTSDFFKAIQDTYNSNKSLTPTLDTYNTIIMASPIKNTSNSNSIGGIAGIYKGGKISDCYVGKDVLISCSSTSDGQAYVGGVVGSLDNSSLVNTNTSANINSSKIQNINNIVCQAEIVYGGNDSATSSMGGLFGAYRHKAFTTKLESSKYNQSWDYNRVIGIDPMNINNILFTGNVHSSSLNSSKVNPVVGIEYITEFNSSNMSTMAGADWTHDSSNNTIRAYPITGSTPSFTASETSYMGSSRINFSKTNMQLDFFDEYETYSPVTNNLYESDGSGGYTLTSDARVVKGKEYYSYTAGDYALVEPFFKTYGQTKISTRAEGVGRFRTTNTAVPVTYTGSTADPDSTNYIQPLRVTVAQIGDGKDETNTFLYTGDPSLGNMKLDTWFASVWDSPKVTSLALTSSRGTLNRSNSAINNDVTKLINQLQIYSSGIDSFNLELKECPINELKYTIASLSNTVTSSWPTNERTISFAYDYNSDIQITFEYNGETAEKTISSGDLCKTITTYDNKYWYLYENKVIDEDNNSLNNNRTFIHLYDNYALDSNGNVLDLCDNGNVVKSVNGLASIDQIKPLWEGNVLVDDEEHYIITFRTYSKSDDLILDNTQLYVIDSELLSFSIDKVITSGPIFMMYGSKKYGSILSSTGNLVEYGEELTYPNTFVNDDIKEISDNISYNKRIALIRYNSGKLIAFDILTGEAKEVMSDEKIIQNIFSFIGSSLKSLLSPSSSGNSKGILSTINNYEEQVDSSAKLKQALDQLEDEIYTSSGGLIDGEEESSLESINTQTSDDNNVNIDNHNEDDDQVSQETKNEINHNNVDTYIVNNKYISLYNSETGVHDIFKASQVLDSDKETVLTEEEKAIKLKEKGIELALNASESNKAEEVNGLAIMILIALSIIALVSILLFTRLNNFYKDE